MAVLKFPPPPDMGRDNQRLNRWLIEIQSILNNSGDIDPDSIAGLPALYLQVAALAVTVAANTASIAANTASIATNTANIAANTASIAANTASIATLTARNQVLNGAGVPAAGLGNNGDLYLNNMGGAGTRLYGKIAAAWVVIA